MKGLLFRLMVAAVAFFAGVGAFVLWPVERGPEIEPPHVPTAAQTIAPNLHHYYYRGHFLPFRGREKVGLTPFNPSGEYQQFDPAGDEDFKFLHFVIEVRRQKGRFKVKGDVRGGGARWFKFSSASVTRERLAFETVEVGGVRYRFEGRFLAGGTFAESMTIPGSVALEGRLEKFVGGRKVAEKHTPFVYYVGC